MALTRPELEVLAGGGDFPDDPLAELVAAPAWHRDAACREHPDVDFFPERTPGVDLAPIIAHAKAICAACLVRGECLDFALGFAANAMPGVWGGTSEAERRRMRQQAA